jgi:hypothetical protein
MQLQRRPSQAVPAALRPRPIRLAHRSDQADWLVAPLASCPVRSRMWVRPQATDDEGSKDHNSRRLLIVPKTTLCRPSHRFTGWFAAMLLAVVAGSSLALFAVLTKAVVDAAGAGFGSLLDTAEFYFWIPAALLGMIFQQSSFRAGSLTASLPTSVVAKPVVGSILGIAVLGETLHAGGARKFVLVTGGVSVFIATVALARDEAATMSTEAVEQTVEEALRRRRRGRTAAAKPPPRMLRLSGRQRRRGFSDRLPPAPDWPT